MDEKILQGLTLEESKELIDIIVSVTKLFDATGSALIRGTELSGKDCKKVYKLIKKYKGENKSEY